MTTQTYHVTGMSCASCSSHVETAVKKLEGMQEVSVNLLTNSMLVSYQDPCNQETILQAVSNAGYGASLQEDASVDFEVQKKQLEDTETPKLFRRFLTSLFLLLPLMYITMGWHMWGWPLPSFLSNSPLLIATIQMILTILVMWINRAFFISGTKGLLHKAPNMDSLVALGSAAAFAYSFVQWVRLLLHPTLGHMILGDLYFESAAMILTLITVGKTLEARSKGKTTSAIQKLMDLAPETACLLKDGKEVTVLAQEVQVGDTFLVKPGQSIPVDGIILQGSSAINEASVTGESIPVEKKENDEVRCATINQTGLLTCKATHVGADTSLSQIIRMVENASATKAPIAKTADKISGIFVPTVIGIACLTFLVWLLLGQTFSYALARAISVLVISCPCALGLATPVAIMVGSGVGARHGILYKTAASLEQTGKTQIAIFDKTGTITQGTPKLTDVYPYGSTSKEEFLSYASTLESGSEHPLARAIVSSVCPLPKALTDFKALVGSGVSGTVQGHPMKAGSVSFMQEQYPLPQEVLDQANAYSSNGKTPLIFSRDNQILGILAVSDTVRLDSKQAIQEFHDLGVETVLLSGDNSTVSNAIAKEVGITRAVAQVLPEEKEQVVTSLSTYGKTAMIGDGINDAPALTKADTGIAIGAGSDIAMDSADVVLMNSSLLDSVKAIRLSRFVLRNIHENLFWAFFYNAIGIPIAAGCFTSFGLTLNPMLGAAAMSLSSVCVVTNALRLNWVSLEHKNEKPRTMVSLPKELFRRDKKEKENIHMTKTVSIEGMMCEHCVEHVHKALSALPGVQEVKVSLNEKQAIISSSTDIENGTIEKAIEDAGYHCTKIA